LPASGVTLYVLKNLMAVGKEITGAITYSLGFALILTSLALLARSALLRRSQAMQLNDDISNVENSARFSPNLEKITTVFTGVILGVLVTLSSVGAGALGTVALLFLYPRMSTLKIVGTDLAHAIPLTTVAGLGHLSLGNFDVQLLMSLLIGSIPGIWIGSHISAKIPERFLRPALACMLFIIGLKFVTQ
jgi:uncharacterized protein